MKLKNYIRENKWFLLVMLIGVVIFAIETSLVALYADDLSLGIISKNGGFFGAFSHMKENYLNWGGGPTPMFAVMFLCFDHTVWKIFSIIILAIMVYCITDMITYKNKKDRWWVSAIIWSCIFILDIAISRETLYWLDGHLAYVFTTFNLLIYFYYLFKKLIQKKDIKKYDYVLMPIVAFFAGWSGPQSGSIVLVMSILLFTYVRFIKKEKIKMQYYISFLIAIAGFLIYYLAPGNNARFETGFPKLAKLNTFELIAYRLDSVFSLLFNYPLNFAGLSFYINIIFAALIQITISNLIKDKNTKRCIKGILYFSSVILLAYITATVIYKLNLMGNNYVSKIFFNYKNIYKEIIAGTFNLKMLIPYITSIFVIIASLFTTLYVSLKEKRPLLFIGVSCGFLAQAIMLLAPYSPIRTTFISVILFILAFSDIALIAKTNEQKFDIILFAVLYYFGIEYLVLGIVLNILLKSFTEKNKLKQIPLVITLAFIASLNTVNVIDGYYKNKKINDINVTRLKSYDGLSKEIKLLKPIDESYGFTKFVGIEWVELDTKRYFNISENVVLIEE